MEKVVLLTDRVKAQFWCREISWGMYRKAKLQNHSPAKKIKQKHLKSYV
jgi:hypothetical protein